MPDSSMPPHQTGTPRARHVSWTRERAGEAADAADLDVDDAAGAEVERAARVLRAERIDSSRQIGVREPPRERRVVDDVVPAERLLDHREARRRRAPASRSASASV